MILSKFHLEKINVFARQYLKSCFTRWYLLHLHLPARTGYNFITWLYFSIMTSAKFSHRFIDKHNAYQFNILKCHQQGPLNSTKHLLRRWYIEVKVKVISAKDMNEVYDKKIWNRSSRSLLIEIKLLLGNWHKWVSELLFKTPLSAVKDIEGHKILNPSLNNEVIKTADNRWSSDFDKR